MSTSIIEGQTFAVVRELIAKDHAIAPETLTPDTPLQSLDIDSLSLIELIFNLEDRFDVVADKVPENLPTLGSVADYIDSLVAARTAAAGGAAPSA